jgi:hypothetical protein
VEFNSKANPEMKMYNTDNLIEQIGIAKEKRGTKKKNTDPSNALEPTFDIEVSYASIVKPTIFITPVETIALINHIQKEVKQRISTLPVEPTRKYITSMFLGHAIQVFKLVFLPHITNNHNKTHSMRKIYAEYSRMTYNPTMKSIPWIYEVLGHTTDTTALSYNTMRVKPLVTMTTEGIDETVKEFAKKLSERYTEFQEQESKLTDAIITMKAKVQEIDEIRRVQSQEFIELPAIEEGKTVEYPKVKRRRKATHESKILKLHVIYRELVEANQVDMNAMTRKHWKSFGFGSDVIQAFMVDLKT